MKAFVTIQNYGSNDEMELFCRVFNHKTLFHAYIVGSNIVIECRGYEMQQLFDAIRHDTAFNWIEYSVQFDCA